MSNDEEKLFQEATDLMEDLYATIWRKNPDYPVMMTALVTMLASEIRLNYPAEEHEEAIRKFTTGVRNTLAANRAFSEEERLEAVAHNKSLAGKSVN